MAAPTEGSVERENRQKNPSAAKYKCLMHLPSVGNEDSEPFSKKRWDTFRKCCSDWKETDGIERTIVENTEPLQHLECEDLPSGTGFHPTCYRWFVDKKRIAAARKRQTAKAESAQQRISSPKLL